MIHVALYMPFAQRTGYAQASHDYALALHRAGVSIQIVPLVDCDLDNLDERYEELIPLATEPPTKAATHVIAHTVPRGVPHFLKGITKDITNIAITTWETTNLDRELAEGIDQCCDLVITPSLFCAEVMSNLETDIEVVPHCFEPGHWPVAEVPPDDSPYTFYSVLSWAERKNPIGLLKAYLGEFDAGDDVVLRLKLSGYSQEDLSALVHATGIPTSDLPELEIITDYYDHEDMVEFHHEGHCFVTAARGEGFNLPAFEAALCGRPVVSPDFGGQRDFLNSYCNSFEYGHRLTPAIVPPTVAPPIEIAGVSVIPVAQVAPSGITARQHWAEPDLYALQKIMRSLYQRRAPVDLSSRKAFEDRFSYATVGAQLASLLERTTK